VASSRSIEFRRGTARFISSLVLAGMVAALSAGCGPDPDTGPAAASGSRPSPVPSGPALSTPGTSAPSASGPATTAAPGAGVPAIGVAEPGAAPVAGAQLGRAAHVGAATIAALPPGTGRGAVARGTVPVVVFHGPRDRKRIALTFDSNMTDSMLRRLASGKTRSYANTTVIDELQQLQAPATFFLAGKWVQAYPALTRRIAADPAFEIASHSWSHEGFRSPCYGLGTIPRADMAADVERSFEILAQFTPHPSRYFRFPGGCYDATALKAIAPVGCTAVEYDDVSGDAFGTSAKTIATKTVAQAKPGSIVVLHITEANALHTGEALPTIVRQLRARGFDLVTLGDLLS
jgi:peptidoglycan/xylan/chitin deacetylase (PgdA/CDA1 family)